MKNILLLSLALGCAILTAGQQPDFRVEGIGSVTIPVTLDKMTNLVFPEPIQSGVKVSRDILAQKVKGVDNVIELKAVRKEFTPTNLSVYGRDGRLYSFVLRYVADTTVLNYRITIEGGARAEIMIPGLPVNTLQLRSDAEALSHRHGYLHVSAHGAGLRLGLSGIYIRDSLQWLTFTLTNRSTLPFRITQMRYYIRKSRSVRRTAEQEAAVEPVYLNRLAAVDGNVVFAAGFEPMIIPAGQRLVMDVTGADGRRIRLQIKGKLLLKTHRP